MPRHCLLRAISAAVITVVCLGQLAPAQIDHVKFPCPEKLSYRVEWHGITAGEATVTTVRPKPNEWQTNMDLESAGMVARLFHVDDKYTSNMGDKYCVSSTELDAQEGKHHKYEKISFDFTHRKVDYYERDYVKNQETRKQLDASACTFEITGALEALRSMSLEPGKSITVPITDGKKFANARIDAQAKENVTVAGKNYATIRYEAFVFDNVLFHRKGRLEVWITDDAERLPVLFRMQMGFPIGTVNVELQKQERS